MTDWKPMPRPAPRGRLDHAAINRLTLRFSGADLEAEYQEQHNTAYRKQAWIWCVAAIAVYSALGLVEWLILPEQRPLAFAARYGVAFVDFGIGFYLAFGVNYDKWFRRSMPVSIGIVFATTALVYVLMMDGYRNLYLCQYVAAVLFLYLHMGLPFRLAAPIGWGACALFAGATLWADGAAWVERDLFSTAVVTIANAMAMFNAYDHELSNRRFFRAEKLLTQQRALEQDLQERLHDLNRHESIGRLAGGVAHDFNNLLQVITGAAAYALERSPVVGTAADQLRLIRKMAHSGASLTRQLLAFSRQNAMNEMPVDLHTLLDQYQPMLERVVPDNVKVELHLDAARSTILADPGMVEQVLLNLTLNARDAMPEGGKLALRTELLEPSQAFLHSRPWARSVPYVVLVFSDTGTGMEPEVRERIFEPFYSTKGVGRGSGLGLSMAYGILRQHDGMIEVQSDPGKGSTFQVYFPLHVPPESVQPVVPAMPAPPPRPAGETLLVVEDNPDLCWVLTEMLGAQGYRILSALNGEQAWDLYQSHRGEIDLALLDVILPKVDGYELFSRIRHLDPDMPVIFTSGYTGSVTDTPPAGAERVPLLRKPYNNEQLYSLIRQMLDQRKSGRAMAKELDVWTLADH